jgi:hypothetical protein
MPDYRIYALDPEAHFFLGPPRIITCDTDHAAIQEATQLHAHDLDEVSLEVWDGTRLVRRITFLDV